MTLEIFQLDTDRFGKNNTAEEQQAWNDMQAGFEDIKDDLKDNINKWKTKAMDQFLLNEDVYLYDFANRESKAGKGPFQCRMLDNKPCCIPTEVWDQTSPSRPSQMMKIIQAHQDSSGKNRKKTACYHHIGMQHEYDQSVGLEDQCWHENDEGVECEGKINFSKIRSKILFSEKFQDWCLYDKNGVPCCTKKLDLVHEWLDKGYLDKSPQQPFIDYLTNYEHKIYVGNDEWLDYWDIVKRYKYTCPAGALYHLDGVDKQQNAGLFDFKTRWNFECPTHHPVPTVAIILGNSRK